MHFGSYASVPVASLHCMWALSKCLFTWKNWSLDQWFSNMDVSGAPLWTPCVTLAVTKRGQGRGWGVQWLQK